MHPWLLHSPPVTSYGTCIVVGLMLAWLVARWNAGRLKVDASKIDLLVPLLVAAGLAGAGLFGYFTDSLTADPVHSNVLFGSLLLATAVGIGYSLLAGIKLGFLGDIVAGPIALGIACGRIGCFFAGCCYGGVCGNDWPLAARFPEHSFAWQDQLSRDLISTGSGSSLPVYPVQLYESLLCVVLAAGLAAGVQRRRISGERFCWLGIGYGVIRFFLEFLRADNPAIALHLTFSQLIALLVIAVACLTLILRRRFADAWNLRITAAPAPGPASVQT